jgi:hypothetical protein
MMLWLRKLQVVPGTAMNDVGLSEKDAIDMAAISPSPADRALRKIGAMCCASQCATAQARSAPHLSRSVAEVGPAHPIRHAPANSINHALGE